MKIKVSLYKSNKNGRKSVWAGYQVDVLQDGRIPEKASYIVQYYGENTKKLGRTNIIGGASKFENMIQFKLNSGFSHSGDAYLETETGFFEEVLS